MTGQTFVSYARNREDVVLWRALGGVEDGCCLAVGDPPDQTTTAFRDRGWTAVDVQLPAPELTTVLSEHGLLERAVHWVELDAAAAPSITQADLHRWRPWVLVIGAGAPNTAEATSAPWEAAVLGADYHLALFDGLSRFYVAREHAERLWPTLSYPVCALDEYVGVEDATARRDRDAWQAQALRWRTAALTTWTQTARRGNGVTELERQLANTSRAAVEAQHEVIRVTEEAAGAHLAVRNLQEEVRGLKAEAVALRNEIQAHRNQLADVYASRSWRVTAPLRGELGRRRGGR